MYGTFYKKKLTFYAHCTGTGMLPATVQACYGSVTGIASAILFD